MKEWFAGVVAGVGAGINSGALMMLTGSEFLDAMGAVGFAVYTVGAGLLFPVVVAKTGNPSAYSVIFLTSISSLFHSLISDLVEIFGLVSLSTYLAYVYTFVLWLVVAVFLVPFTVAAGDPAVAFPNWGGSGIIGHIVYALFLGSFYGFVLQDYL